MTKLEGGALVVDGRRGEEITWRHPRLRPPQTPFALPAALLLPPLHKLSLAVLLGHHPLGETGELPVHSLVEAPRLDDGKPEGVKLIEDEPGSLNRTAQPRRIYDVELRASEAYSMHGEVVCVGHRVFQEGGGAKGKTR